MKLEKGTKSVGASHTKWGTVCGGTWSVCADYRFLFLFFFINFFYHKKSFNKEIKKNVNN